MTASTQLVPSRDLKSELLSPAMAARIKGLLPKHVPAERIARLALMATSKNPALLRCSRESFFLSVLVAARLGLEPDGTLGEGYLVPYGETATFLPGYRGLIALALRSGKVKSIVSRVVYEGDSFRVTYGTEDKIRHTPGDDEPGDWTHVYAVATLDDGTKQFEVMSHGQVMAIKKRSRASGSGPWVTDETEMARKTVIRRIAKSLPLSADFASGLALQAGGEAGESVVADVAAELGIESDPGAVHIRATVDAPAGNLSSVTPANPTNGAPETLAEKRKRAKAAQTPPTAAAPTAAAKAPGEGATPASPPSPSPGAVPSPAAAPVPAPGAVVPAPVSPLVAKIADLKARLGGDQWEDLAFILVDGPPDDTRDRGIMDAVRKAVVATGVTEKDFAAKASEFGAEPDDVWTVGVCRKLAWALPAKTA